MKMPFLTGLLILATPVILRGESPPAEPIELKTAPGFEAERVFAAGASDGSWSAMAVDPRGRLVISPQGSEPMLRVALPEDGKPARVEKLDVPATSAMGLLFAFDNFYVNGKGPQGSGLYRLRDTKGADAYDEVTLLRKLSRIENPPTEIAKISASSWSRVSIHSLRSCCPSPSKQARRTQRVTQ